MKIDSLISNLDFTDHELVHKLITDRHWFLNSLDITKEELKILDDYRFEEGGLPEAGYLELDSRIKTFLYVEFNIFLKQWNPIPTNHQVVCYVQQRQVLHRTNKMPFACFEEQGLGKSKQTIMIADYLYRQGMIDRLLIICPKALKEQWIDEQFPIHYPGKFKGMAWDGFSSQSKRSEYRELTEYPELKIFTVNVDAFSHDAVTEFVRYFCRTDKEVLLLVDESTSIKNGRRKTVSKRAKQKGAKRANTILWGFKSRPYKMILTGTASPNRPADLWGQIEFLVYNFFSLDWWDFCKRYQEMINCRRGRGTDKKISLELLDKKTYGYVKSDIQKIITEGGKIDSEDLEMIALNRGLTESSVQRISKMQEYLPYKNLDELKKRISPITFFCKTVDCVDLPPRIPNPISCIMEGEQKRVYNDIAKSMMSLYEGSEITILHKHICYMRLQQVTSGFFPYEEEVYKAFTEESMEVFPEMEFKVKPLKDNIKLKVLMEELEDIDPEQSIILWAHFIHDQKLLYDRLSEKYGSEHVGLYRGSDKYKNEIKKAFQAGEIKKFISGDTGSEGLNLQISHLQYFYSNNFKADKRDQKEKRSHRIGQKDTVICSDLLCKGTVDERIYDVLKMKLDLIDYFRDSGRENWL